MVVSDPITWLTMSITVSRSRVRCRRARWTEVDSKPLMTAMTAATGMSQRSIGWS